MIKFLLTALATAATGLLLGAPAAHAEQHQNVLDVDGTQGEFTDSVHGVWDRDGTRGDFRDAMVGDIRTGWVTITSH